VTNYNNFPRIERALDTLMEALRDTDFEMVVVDSCSTDGSFELLQEYSRRHKNIKVLRKKCTRGLGRQIAFEHSRGRLIIFADMDCSYDSSKIRELVKIYEIFYKGKILITPSSILIGSREVVEKVGGWRDYNSADDIDFLTRAFILNRGVFIPVRVAENEPFPESPVSFFGARMVLFGRERRYEKNLFKLFFRKLRFTLDSYSANAYTLRKIYLRHRMFGISPIVTFLYSPLLAFSRIFSFCLRRKPISADPHLFNNLYLVYKMIENMVNPAKFGFPGEDMRSFISNEEISFISKFYPGVQNRIVEIAGEEDPLNQEMIFSQGTRRKKTSPKIRYDE
jgi:glycosyltransferase involved in cell wall biosynthesis